MGPGPGHGTTANLNINGCVNEISYGHVYFVRPRRAVRPHGAVRPLRYDVLTIFLRKMG